MPVFKSHAQNKYLHCQKRVANAIDKSTYLRQQLEDADRESALAMVALTEAENYVNEATLETNEN